MSRSAIEESLAAALTHVEEAETAVRAHKPAPGGNTPLPVHPTELAEALTLVDNLVRRLGATLGRYSDLLRNAPDTGQVPELLHEHTANAGHALRALAKKLHRGINAGNAHTAIAVLDDRTADWRIARRRRHDTSNHH